MDKAGTTLIFACPKLYVDRLLSDLESGGTYTPATIPVDLLLSAHNGFCSHFGIPVDMHCQEMPHLVDTFKMHKNPIGMRFISASHLSSMRSVSILVNRLLTQFLPGVDALLVSQHHGHSAAGSLKPLQLLFL